MKVLAAGGEPTEFFRRLRQTGQGVLLLDYDGTLAPFSVCRDRATPYPGVVSALRALQSTSARLALVSGRPTADVGRLLGLEPWPELWGCHGWEHRPAGGAARTLPLPDTSRAALAQGRQQVKQAGLGERVEDKAISLALHWRGLPLASQEALRAQATALWQPLTGGTGLELHPFDGGLELRCHLRTKTDAVRDILVETPAAVPAAYLGDDRTDEDAFAALRPQDLPVLVRSEWRDTLARLWLRPPAALLDFFALWAEALGATEGNNG